MTGACGCGSALCPWCHDRDIKTRWLTCDRCGEYELSSVPSECTTWLMVCDCTPEDFVACTVCDAPRCAYCREEATVMHGQPMCAWHADSGVGRREAFEIDEAAQ